LLQFADLGIRDYSIRKTPSIGNESGPEFENTKTSGHNLELEFLHGIDEEAHLVLLAEEESAGTNRFYAILAQRIEVLSKGQSVLVEKLDESLHPLLMRATVGLFHNPAVNCNNAQLIFNTHDTTLLDHLLFWSDPIWIMEKDPGGPSHLYSLVEYSPRKGESLDIFGPVWGDSVPERVSGDYWTRGVMLVCRKKNSCT
jgi:uncharacterized protein